MLSFNATALIWTRDIVCLLVLEATVTVDSGKTGATRAHPVAFAISVSFYVSILESHRSGGMATAKQISIFVRSIRRKMSVHVLFWTCCRAAGTG